MKYCSDVFSQFKIKITIFMSRTSIFNSYMIIMSDFIISFIIFIASLKVFFIIYSHYKIFAKVLFIALFQYSYPLRTAVINLLTAFFSSAKNNRLAKSMINRHNFISKTARNMLLIFFGLGKFKSA